MPKDNVNDPVADHIIVRRRDLYEMVVMQTGVRTGEVRLVIDSLLSSIHQTLAEGAHVHIPPLGHIRPITRVTDEGSQIVYKLKLTKSEKPAD